MPASGSPPLTGLLSALAQPAALVGAEGALSWTSPSFRDLFRPEAPPATLAEWESRSPPGPGPLMEELRRSRVAVRGLATASGVSPLRLAWVSSPAGDGVLLCEGGARRSGLHELRERTAILEAMFHSLSEGVFALDDQHRITAMSRSAERLTGFAEGEVQGKVCGEVFQAPPGTECPFHEVVRTGTGFSQRDLVIRGKGGRAIHVAATATPLRTRAGAVEGAVVVLRDLAEIDRLRKHIDTGSSAYGIIGAHPLVRRVVEKVETVAPSEASILILGESGTGKELVAHAVHRLSARQDGPFVKVNCAALADTLLESELFGHVRGAFTGAVKDRPGRFEAADGGTLFLDEIGETSPSLQVRLLRVLQEGEFERVGESRTRKADVRIVAATNRDLRREVAEGRFRDDLFYRLCVVPIQMPPLRERRDDIPLLVDHFLKRLAAKEGRRKIVSPAVYPVLLHYAWPGNVRELENAVAHAYVCSAGDTLTPEALPEHLLAADPPPGTPDPAAEERRAVRDALDATGWNKGEAAQRLGLSRTTLWRRMRDLGIRDRRRA